MDHKVFLDIHRCPLVGINARTFKHTHVPNFQYTIDSQFPVIKYNINTDQPVNSFKYITGPDGVEIDLHTEVNNLHQQGTLIVALVVKLPWAISRHIEEQGTSRLLEFYDVH